MATQTSSEVFSMSICGCGIVDRCSRPCVVSRCRICFDWQMAPILRIVREARNSKTGPRRVELFYCPSKRTDQGQAWDCM